MDSSTALLIHLADLASSIGADVEVRHAPLWALVRDLSVAIPSYCGLQLTILECGQPVTLTDLSTPDVSAAAVSTSLRVPLSLLGPGHHCSSRVIFYASAPGALVDLAADLAYLLRTSATTDPGNLLLVLDADLPPSTMVSGLTGLVELTTVNRALGILIGRGHSCDEAFDRLELEAAAAGIAAHVYAARLLGR